MQPTRPGSHLLQWGIFVVGTIVYMAICVPVGLSLPLKAVSTGYQVIGALLALLGVAVIGDLLQRAAALVEAAVALRRHRASRRLRSWAERLQIAIRSRVARLLGQPPPVVHKTASDTATIGASATLGWQIRPRERVDRDPISDRDWLTYLDDEVDSLATLMSAEQRARHEQREQYQGRLRDQADELRREIFRASRTGWPLVVGGLAFSLVGALLGGWA
jgi:hypothetical protein